MHYTPIRTQMLCNMSFVAWIIFCSVVVYAQLPDPYGRVIIGTFQNDTTDFYSFNENYGSLFTVPVYLVLVNGTTDDVLPDPPQMDVTVTCESSPAQFGYTQAKFATELIQEFGTVDFSSPVPGRPVQLRCWGNRAPEFSKEFSLSEPVMFEIRPAGKVSITQPVVLVANEPASSTVKGSFIVELSEQAEIYSVNVTCTQNSTGSIGPMRLMFEETTIFDGERKGSVDYTLIRRGQPVTVICVAQSDTKIDAQFQKATSQGEGARFMLATSSVILVPEKSELKATQINVTLILDSTPTTDVVFACYLRMADNSEQARELAKKPICQMPLDVLPTSLPGVSLPGPTPTPAPEPTPPDSDEVWHLKNNIVAFQTNSDLHQSLMINRTTEVSSPTAELFVVTCCAPESDNTNPKYINISTALVIASYLTPFLSINWTDATAPADNEKETEIFNPAFVEVSPCSCDVYEDACDINCCCDNNCKEDDVVLFTCLPGLFGGNTSAPPSYMCDAPYTQQPDWFTMMCVQWNNSAFLGHFIYPEPALRDVTSYKAKAEQYRLPHSFMRNTDKLPVESNYKAGSSVRTGLPMNEVEENNYYIGNNFRLTLPKRTLGGTCVVSSPVQFLHESNDDCIWTMKESLCTTYSPLSALVYVQADQWVGVKGPLVLSSLGVSSITTTNINYLCTNSTEDYLQSPDKYRDLVLPDQTYLFDYQIPAEDDCSFNPASGAYICINQTNAIPTSPPQPTRCAFDDGFTKPPSPVYNQATDMCTNVVLSVLYNFTWQGTSIVSLNATITLGDIPMTTVASDASRGNNKTVLTQTFDVLFHHKMSNITVNYTDADYEKYVKINRTDQYKRSGKPGYDWNKPVISGVAVYESNDTFVSDQFKYVDSNSSNRLSLWQPGADGLCYSAGRQDIMFGVNSLGTCLLKLGYTELQDCAQLRRLILNRQDSLMLSTLVSLGGDPDYKDLISDWVPVLRQDVRYILGENDGGTMTTSVDSATTPSLVNPTTVSPNLTTSILDRVSGRCTSIPSHITADIMYAKVGERDAMPLWQIVGAKISYTLSTWQLYCVGPGGTSCYTNTTWIQKMTNGGDMKQAFQLYSSVRYTEVPATDPKPKTLFKEQTEPRVWKCKQDACIEEIFYPFLKINPGDSYQYTTSVGLICLVFLFGLFLISRPVSRWDYIHGEL